jgi:DNA-binding NarL/FixJ family response regulator
MSPERPVQPEARSTPRIRIVVADDQALDRSGLVALLRAEPSFDVLAETSSVENTIDRCKELRPDVLVLALKICTQKDEPAIPAIRSRLPATRILAMAERSPEHCLVLNPPWRKALAGTPAGPPPTGMNCLELAAHQGALATLRRSADPQDLYLAVRMVARGQACYDPTTSMGILGGSGDERAGSARMAPLSKRELQVAALLVEAHSNKEIASLLGLREPTVKKHVRHILEKLGLQDRLQAGLYLARNPLLLKS